MTPPKPTVIAGIDVGKSGLDAHILEGSLERHFKNDKCGRRALRKWLLQHGVSRAVFEPTGRYHRRLHQCLFEAGLETVLVNPLRSRRFAEALGQLAKNDRVDAAMLARFGQLDSLVATPPQDDNLQLLSDLLAARRKLVIQLGALRKLRAEIIQAVPGCGPVTAACLCAEMPELGTIGRRQAASLLGLAPFDQDSGKQHGRRSIRGGRAQPRHSLYMAALSATRWEPACKACYQRLIADKKEHKVAMVAVMRKLACLLTALLREDRCWQSEPPARELPAAA